jgi:hypothetical protein
MRLTVVKKSPAGIGVSDADEVHSACSFVRRCAGPAMVVSAVAAMLLLMVPAEAEASTVRALAPTVVNYSGSTTAVTVPAGAQSVEIDAYGANGGDGGGNSLFTSSGGFGAHVVGDLGVVPGHVYSVSVGGQGKNGGANLGLGGWGGSRGGGNGGGHSYAGGGGGATSVTGPGGVLVLVAGGGGGGGNGVPISGGAGGNAGASAQPGGTGRGSGPGFGGGGGIMPGGLGSSGEPGTQGGGGGGGGLNGGGGGGAGSFFGSAGGGGAGSSTGGILISPVISTFQAWVNGRVTFTWSSAPAPLTMTKVGNWSQSQKVGEQFAPLGVQILNGLVAVFDLPVTFTITNQSGAATFPGRALDATINTDHNGRAYVPTLTADRPGVFTLTAKIPDGGTTSATFTITGTVIQHH